MKLKFEQPGTAAEILMKGLLRDPVTVIQRRIQ
jgi:hypothetical protein